ncbi:MAG: VanZ family protein [Gemmatimonadaceae bacterium]
MLRIDPQQSRRWGYLLTAAWFAAVLALTLTPTEPLREGGRRFDWCIACTELGTQDLLLNAALFIPLGALLAWRGVALPRVLAASLAFSTAIEVTQLIAVTGRDPSLSDIVANSLGGALGVGLVRAFRYLASAPPAAWRAVCWGSVLFATGALAFGAWAVQVRVPRVETFSQWQPQRRGYLPFEGSLRALEVNGSDTPAAVRLQPSQLPAAFFEGDIDVRGEVLPGPRPRRRGIAIVGRLALRAGEVFMFGRQDDALVVRYRANAVRLGLRQPIFALEHAFGGDVRSAVAVRAIRSGDVLQLRAIGVAEENVASTIRISAARLWATLLPFNRGFGAGAGALGDMLWLGLLFAPSALAGVRAYRGGRSLAAIGVQWVALACLAFIQPTLWWWPLWIGAGLGAGAGYWLGRRTL